MPSVVSFFFYLLPGKAKMDEKTRNTRPELPRELWQMIFALCPPYSRVVLPFVNRIFWSLFREAAERRRTAWVSPKHETYERLVPPQLRKYGGRNLKKRKQTRFAVALAEAGYLNLLKWAHSQGFYFFHQKVCNAAARAGHLHILQYFDDLGKKYFRINHTTFGAAASTAQMEILEWLRSKDYRFKVFTLRDAALAGHLGVLEWARGINADDNAWAQTVIPAAAEGGHLHILHWFASQESRKMRWSPNLLLWGAARGGREVVEWLRANYQAYQNPGDWIEWAKNLARNAARGGQLSLLQKLAATIGPTNDGQWRNRVTRSASLGGHMDLLRWWESENSAIGFFNPDDVASSAAQAGHLDVLEWLVRDLRYGTSSQLGTIASGAIRGSQVHVIEFLREKGGWSGS